MEQPKTTAAVQNNTTAVNTNKRSVYLWKQWELPLSDKERFMLSYLSYRHDAVYAAMRQLGTGKQEEEDDM
jgi:hypothetical protein